MPYLHLCDTFIWRIYKLVIQIQPTFHKSLCAARNCQNHRLQRKQTNLNLIIFLFFSYEDMWSYFLSCVHLIRNEYAGGNLDFLFFLVERDAPCLSQCRQRKLYFEFLTVDFKSNFFSKFNRKRNQIIRFLYVSFFARLCPTKPRFN